MWNLKKYEDPITDLTTERSKANNQLVHNKSSGGVK